MLTEILKYFLQSKPIDKIEDEAIVELNEFVFQPSYNVKDSEILNLISSLKLDESLVTVNDLGAGSKKDNHSIRKVKAIAKNAATRPKFGRLLNQMVKHYKVEHVLELGTSLGIGSLYLALNNDKVKITTIEGCSNIASIAQKNFQKLNQSNISSLVGDFKTQIELLPNFEGSQLIFIDGDHTYDSTKYYFEVLLKKAAPNTIFVFDDIYWSRGMHRAWLEIIQSKAVTLSLDLFRMGIVFTSPVGSKKNFKIRF